MEENFLCFFTACQKLHIIQNQQVNLQVKILEILELVVLQSVEELCCKIVLIDIQHNFIGHVVADLVPDGLNQMGFTHTHATVQHQRVKGRNAGFFCHS